MFSIFVWSALSSFLTTIAAEAAAESKRASSDYNQGVARHRAQQEAMDLLRRMNQ